MTGDKPNFPHDYFISRRGSVADTAREVANVLTGANYKVIVQDHDFPSGGKFTLDIHDGLKTCRHLIILHTAEYDASFWTREEFAHFVPAVADILVTNEIPTALMLIHTDDRGPVRHGGPSPHGR